MGAATDCNANTILDECEISAGSATDCNGDLIPDDCATVATELLRTIPDDVQGGDETGTGVALKGRVAAVSAWLQDSAGTDSGSIYVYRLLDNGWTPWQKLIPSDLHANDRLGWAMAIDDTRIAIGAHLADAAGADSGAVFTYRLEDDSWVEEQKIVPWDGGPGDRFGSAIALDGEWLVAGSFYHDGRGADAGAAYVYRFDGTSWQNFQKLEPAQIESYDWTGRAVCVQGATIGVGVPHSDAAGYDAGAVVIYAFNGASWIESATLAPPATTQQFEFGMALDLEDDTLVVGAPSIYAAPATGSVYVFRRAGGGWLLDQELPDPSVIPGGRYGLTVAVSRDKLVVGAQRDDFGAPESGSATVFTRTAGAWSLTDRLLGSGSGPGSMFGHSVAIEGNHVLAGARRDDAVDTDTGAFYIFHLNEDCDGNGQLDVCDLADGLDADCDGNAVLDGCDIAFGFSDDCNGNAVPDECDLASGVSRDCNHTGVPDGCEPIGQGDFDGDGQVNLIDFAALPGCVAGPERQPAPAPAICAETCLRAFDLDSDGDVDLADFAGLQLGY